ncbi:MAG TPA: hypothetical protein VHE99_10790 [Gammaproteobacteria bacterium]|nr:hypothetical protein [Gammaproteobacteria bacterium]
MKQYSARIKYGCAVLLALLSVKSILAATDPLSSMTQIPTQQFVTADDDSGAPSADSAPAADTPDNSAANPDIPLQQSTTPVTVVPVTGNTVQPTLPLTPPIPGSENTLQGTPRSNAPLVQSIPVPSTNLPLSPPVNPTPIGALPQAAETGGQAVALSPEDAAQVAAPEFVGGIDRQPFIYCSRLSTVVCNQATNDTTFRSCLSTITQPGCKQYMSFAARAGFNRGDVVDSTQHIQQGQLDLVHVKRFGVNFPGDYYVIGAKGNFYNMTSGPEAQAINIKASPNFPMMQQRFAQPQLWSIIDNPPRVEALSTGGVRLVFRFKILNGCATCETAGYANVAYDFSADGVLTQVQLLSLDV